MFVNRKGTLLMYFAARASVREDLAERLQMQTDCSRILDAYGDSLLRFACSYTHNLADAQEIVQDTLLAWLNKAPEFSRPESEKAWLLQVCANLAKNKIRFNARRSAASLENLGEPAIAVSDKPDLSFVWQAVAKLPVNYRSAVHLYYEEGYSTMEIAQILKRKESTVRTWLTRARAKLKEILQEDYDFE